MSKSMFRRPGKNPLEEDNLPLFSEDNSLPYKYGNKKTEMHHHAEMQTRMFEPPSMNSSSMPSYLDERRAERFYPEKSAPLPHHFKGSLEDEPETTLGAGVTFRGELSFERLLRIDGTFEGELLSQGKVIVGPQGIVKANLNLREAIIEGRVEGNIIVQERLELRGEAVVEGDIEAKFLSVDEGVRIQGLVQVVGNVKPAQSPIAPP